MEPRYADLMKRYPELQNACEESLLKTAQLWIDTFQHGGTLYICGNGGSCADAEHITGELLKGFMLRRPLKDSERQALENAGGEIGTALASELQGALPAVALHSHIGVLTAFANDVNPADIYAQVLYAWGRRGDCLVGITTSGNADNVLRAMVVARAKGVTTVLLTGDNSAGKCRKYADIVLAVPAHETFKVQELHLPVYHCLCQMVEDHFYGN